MGEPRGRSSRLLRLDLLLQIDPSAPGSRAGYISRPRPLITSFLSARLSRRASRGRTPTFHPTSEVLTCYHDRRPFATRPSKNRRLPPRPSASASTRHATATIRGSSRGRSHDDRLPRMTLAFLSLGFSPLSGKRAVDQAITLKRQLRAVLPFVENAYPLIVPESRRCEVRVAFERGDERAEAWARRAAEIAPELWESVAERRRVVEV